MTITYAMTASVLVIGLCIMFFDAVSKLRGSEHRTISIILIGSTMVYVTLDCLWIVQYTASDADYSQGAFTALNFLFYLAYITLPYIWFLFAQHFARNISHMRGLNIALALPWLFNLALVLATMLGADLLWTIGDASARYTRGPLFSIFTNVNLVYYFIPVIEILYLLASGKGADRRTLLTTLGFAAIPALSVLIYTFFISVDAIYPFQPCCFFVGVMFAYVLIVSQLYRREAERAKRANEAKTTFLFNMSHDIRTPMNAITGFTAMAKQHIDEPDQVREYLDKIETSGHQLLSLINQVLEMSRIESGKVSVEEVRADIVERCQAMVTVVKSQAAAKDLRFHFEQRNVVHRDVYADDTKMSQITLNILGNAVKFTPQGGRIDYMLEESPSPREGYANYTFTISDTGIGMSEDFQKMVFEPFARESTSTVSKIQGTGLGMSIVRDLVELMDGEISIDSKQGRGTTVRICVPLRLAEPEAHSDAVGESAVWDTSGLAGKRVLLVEDNEMNREIASYILSENGLVVEHADDGDVAVEMVRAAFERGETRYYDAVLMDIQMPRMDGFEATRAIRALASPDGSRIPIIAMTANAFEEDRQKAFDAGMDAHLAKPIDVQAMLETLVQFTR